MTTYRAPRPDPGLAWLLAATLLLFGCRGEILYTCGYTDEHPDGSVDEGTYTSGEMTCGDYCWGGNQLLLQEEFDCREDRPADVTRDCACTVDISKGCERWLSRRGECKD